MRGQAKTDFDLIVVGGGHNGLVCAAYVARAGYSVCVVERAEAVGGAAVTEEFHPGFRNSVASYTVGLLQSKIIHDLELERLGLTILPRPLDNFVPCLDGPGLELPREPVARHEAIARHSQRDAERYSEYRRRLDRVAGLLRSFLLEEPIDLRAGIGEIQRALAAAARLLGAGPRTIRDALHLVTGSARDWLDGFFATDLLKGGLGFDSVVGHFASPYQPGSGYLLLHHCLGGVASLDGSWGHAVGGMGAISDAIAAAAIAHGAVINVGSGVDAITPGDGVIEIEADSKRLTARAVACAIHPQTLYLRLLDPTALPAGLVDRMRNWRSESASFRINVALSELPDFSCAPGAGPHHGAGVLISPSLRYLDDAYRSGLADGYSLLPVIELLIPSVIDDTLAPAGAHVASLFCQHFRYELPGNRSWTDAKDAAVDRIIDTVTAYAPNFRRAVVATQALSPADLEQRFGLIGGDIFHGAMTRDQLYWSRPVPRYARYRSPVPGVYLCASGGHPGGGVTGAPGHNAARAILNDWRRA